jgi:predicted cupin superfamily sugar epimerase
MTSFIEKSPEYWIEKLGLSKHPEGGHFKEVYRSDEVLEPNGLPGRYKGPRSFSTSIYFLLNKREVSRFHRIASDEIWHFYAGSSLTLFLIHPQGDLSCVSLGKDPENGESLQTVIPRMTWFGARVNDPSSFSLAGCTVAPGFDFSDFELGDPGELIRLFPRHERTIRELT